MCQASISRPTAAPLPPAFYQRDAVTVARALLGQRLVRILDDGTRLAGTIVETEAYLGIRDAAAHTANGRRTQRNASMWTPGGHAYVYFTYGMHHCFNVSASHADDPVAILIRALEPTEGLDAMTRRRAVARRPTDLCSGPAKLTQALDIDLRLDGENMAASNQLFIEQTRQRALPNRCITTTARIGIAYAGQWTDKPLRYYITGNPHVSKP